MIRLTAGMAAWCRRLIRRTQDAAARPLLADPDARRKALALRMERLADRMTARQPASLGPRINVGRRRE